MEIAGIKLDSFEQLNDDSLQSFLHPAELTEYVRLNASGKLDWLAGRLVVKKALLNYSLPLEIKPSKFFIDKFDSGQPFISGYNHLYCSISHSRSWGIGVVSDQPVGIDIEKIRVHTPELLPYIATDQEIDALRRYFSSDDVLVTAIWTIKESIMKALGIGFRIAPKQVVTQMFTGNSARVIVTPNKHTGFSEWQVYISEIQDFYISLAYQNKINDRPRINWHNTVRLQLSRA